MATSLAELSADELSTLSVYEGVIRQGLESFVEVGNALARIRDARLYRAEFATFEDYCDKKWSLTRQYVNRIVAAAEVVADIESAEMETIVSKPANEAQAKPLASVRKEDRAEVWQQVVATAPVDARTAKPKITAKHVEKVVEQAKKMVDTPDSGECVINGRHEWETDGNGDEFCSWCKEDRPVEKKPVKVEPEGIIGKFIRLVWNDATKQERAVLMTWFREMEQTKE